MKSIGIFLGWAIVAYGQLLPPSGGGAGTVTSVVIQGTANETDVSGTCTITTSGTCTVGNVANPTIGGANITAIPASGVLNPGYQLTKFRVAYAKTRDGVADTKILFIGDSIPAGNGSTLPNNQSYGAYPARVTLGHNPLIQARPNLILYPSHQDDRCTLGTGWSGYSGGYGFGASSAWLANGAAGNLVCAAGAQNGTYDTYNIYYRRYSGGGSFTATATGGASSGTISTNGADAVLKTTITAAAANNTNTVTLTNPAGQILILAIEASLSTRKSVLISNAGVNSSQASGSGSASWSSTESILAINAFAPDLCFIELGTNDANLGFTKAVVKAGLQTIITACQTSGSVVLIKGHPSSDSTTESFMTQYRTAMDELGVTNSVPTLDIFARFGGVFQTTLSADAYHLNEVGAWDEGAAITDFLNTVLGNDPTSALAIGAAFASLGTPANGSQVYCADCTVTSGVDNTCAGSGTGASAARINGAWKCSQ